MTPNTAHKKNKSDIEAWDKDILAPLLAKHPDNPTLRAVKTLHKKIIKRCGESIALTKKSGYTAEYERLWAVLKYGSKPKGQEEWNEHVDSPEEVLAAAKLYVKRIKKDDISKKMIQLWIHEERWREFEGECEAAVKDKPKCHICKQGNAVKVISIKPRSSAFVCVECVKHDNKTVEEIRAERNKA